MTTTSQSISDFFKPRTEKRTSKNVESIEKSKDSPKETTTLEKLGSEECVMFSDLCAIFEKIEATTKRLEINEILTGFFIEVMKKFPSDLVTIVHLSLSKLGPSYEGVELGLGEALLIKAIVTCTGTSTATVKQEIEERGDIGLVAVACRSTQRTMFQPKPLSVQSIFKVLKEIATVSGHSSMSKKIEKVRSLLVACQGNEAKYLFRLLEGKLRIGLAEQSVLAALAHASVSFHHHDEKTNLVENFDPVSIIKSVYNSLPDYNIIIPALLNHEISRLPDVCHLTPGVPLKPMLAFPTKSISEVLDRFEGLSFTCEYKYDGERAQIHRLENGQVFIYSRNSENMTQKYPDIMKKIVQVSKPSINSYVLDCEVVAYSPKDNKILPFQILSTRKRKDVDSNTIEVEVCLFAFDLLFLNGQSLVENSFRERRSLLQANFNDVPGEFHFAQHMDSSSVDDIQTFLDESVKHGCEGLMIKTLDAESSYEPSKRSRKWLKVKKDYIDGVGDSLDLVVIGGYAGRGKRTGVYGGYLLACFNPENEEYQAICKIGSGFSESDLELQASFFKDHIIPVPKSYYHVTDGIRPDVWFEPVQVWEVKAADFSISPIYTAAWDLVGQGKGISLRFPRFIKAREDKNPEDATTGSFIAELYNNQVLASSSKNQDFEEDY